MRLCHWQTNAIPEATILAVDKTGSNCQLNARKSRDERGQIVFTVPEREEELARYSCNALQHLKYYRSEAHHLFAYDVVIHPNSFCL